MRTPAAEIRWVFRSLHGVCVHDGKVSELIPGEVQKRIMHTKRIHKTNRTRCSF